MQGGGNGVYHGSADVHGYERCFCEVDSEASGHGEIVKDVF